MANETLTPAADVELPRLIGAWYLLITNYEFWRTRTHPRVEYDALEPHHDGRPRLRNSLRYRDRDLLGRPQRRLRVGIDVAAGVGAFVRRGDGFGKGLLEGLSKRRWWVALAHPDYRWIVIWSARSHIGTGAGLDICTRDPWIPQALLDEILSEIHAHPFLGADGRSDELFATVQDWIPPRPYQLR